jgi:hypothetical protein
MELDLITRGRQIVDGTGMPSRVPGAERRPRRWHAACPNLDRLPAVAGCGGAEEPDHVDHVR